MATLIEEGREHYQAGLATLRHASDLDDLAAFNALIDEGMRIDDFLEDCDIVCREGHGSPEIAAMMRHLKTLCQRLSAASIRLDNLHGGELKWS